MQKSENVFLLSGMLCIITAAVALLLGLVNYATSENIKKYMQQEQIAARKSVLREADTFSPIAYPFDGDGTVLQICAGKQNGETVGYCVSISTTGFGGAIELMVGVRNTGTIGGVVIVSHNETPGLGSKAQEPDFCSQFINQRIGDTLKVVKGEARQKREIVAVSGATLTSKAVTEGVNAALAAVLKVQEGGIS